jgi:hypothetical protein
MEASVATLGGSLIVAGTNLVLVGLILVQKTKPKRMLDDSTQFLDRLSDSVRDERCAEQGLFFHAQAAITKRILIVAAALCSTIAFAQTPKVR